MLILAAAAIHIVGMSPAEAQSKAAAYLVKQAIADGCEGRPGTIGLSGAIERDRDGDGLPDLIIAEDEIHCSGESARSIKCGMQVCSVTFYLRRRPILQKVHDMLGSGVSVGNERIPKISMYAHGGRRGSVHWNGRGFAYL
ncbi:hypothetical protein [Methylobacterium brachythecii]|nr:hypothetical protein [Methylobacterium brachythecii]MBB3900932.1 hypothetical protein [Methylobacterium brachythecii]